MCQHGDLTKSLIEGLVQELYPAIQHQFIVVSSADNNLHAANDPRHQLVQELINDLKNEFQSLISYENKLVFPSVLRAFDKKTDHAPAATPNIAELQSLTAIKEQKIAHILDNLSSEIDRPPVAPDNEIHKLIRLFTNDFTMERIKWNKMIRNRLNSCACFIHTNDLNKTNTHA